jgi:hypothetical protein
MIISFYGSILTNKKVKVDQVNTEDESLANVTTAMMCPFRVDQLTNIQIAFVNAFNRSM